MKLNEKKALYESIMKSVSKTIRKKLNEANNGMHMDLHDDFAITQDENTAKSTIAYLHAINKKKQLSHADEVKLADIIQHSDNKREVEKAKNKLVSANLPFVISVVNKYKNINIPKEDMIQYGNIGLMQAADTYDPSLPGKDVRFVSYAIWYIRREIMTAVDEVGGHMAVPRNMGSIAREAARIKDQLYNKNGYEPDIDDIYNVLVKKHPDLKYETFAQTMEANTHANSLDKSYGDDDDSKTTLGDVTANRTFKDPDSNLNNADLERELEDNVKRVLGERDGEIVCDCYGINGRGEKNTWQVAEEHGMTETRVLQILRAAYPKLKADEETKMLLQYIM